ncbi:unnamed protein product, partial [Schistosoma margrebowiei]
MQCDNCKGWFHEACTDLTSTAYNRLSKSDQKWNCFGNRFLETINTMETRSKRLKENDEMDSKLSKAVCGMSDVNDDKCDDVSIN